MSDVFLYAVGVDPVLADPNGPAAPANAGISRTIGCTRYLEMPKHEKKKKVVAPRLQKRLAGKRRREEIELLCSECI